MAPSDASLHTQLPTAACFGTHASQGTVVSDALKTALKCSVFL